MKHLLHRDQIHRDTFFDPLSVELINSSQMQRLGRVYQLGFAHLVYRGGTHTRLSHVMGTAHIAETLVNSLKKNYERNIRSNTLPKGAIEPDKFLPRTAFKKKNYTIEDQWDVLTHLVRWGALLHDLGHVPFGHTLEDEFTGIYKKHDSFDSPRMSYLWGEDSLLKEIFKKEELYPQSFKKINIHVEDVWRTVMMICLFKVSNHSEEITTSDNDGFIHTYYESYKKVSDTLFHQYMADIVSDTICADYLDYLQRDTLNVGLDSVRDVRIVQSYFVGIDAINGRLRMALSLVDKGGKPKLSICNAAKTLVSHRFNLAEIIYYHKTKASASAMLAKVFSLIDNPSETRHQDMDINLFDIQKIDDNVSKFLQEDTKSILELKNNCLPHSLLDPCVGDESLLLWLRFKAWEKIENSQLEKNTEEIKKALLSISLLKNITERNLYKVIVAIDAPMVGEVVSNLTTTIEGEIKRILNTYRKEEEIGQVKAKDQLETVLAKEIDWPEGVFICYVPDRKVQAKGIETGALEVHGKVITMGEHDAIKDDVAMLNRDYQNLWRFLLFVHPDYCRNINDNCIKFSYAVDKMFELIFPSIKAKEKESVIKKACWFRYVSQHYRNASEIYLETFKYCFNNNEIKWKYFDLAIDTLPYETTVSQELVDRAIALAYIDQELNLKELDENSQLFTDNELVEIIKVSFSEAESLIHEINRTHISKSKTSEYAKDGMPLAQSRAIKIKSIALNLAIKYSQKGNKLF